MPFVAALLSIVAAAWQSVLAPDGSAPVARHEAGLVAHGGALYLIGGRGALPVDRYDVASGTWTSLGVPPVEMHHLQPVVLDGHVHVVCAFTGAFPNEPPLTHAWVYDPELDAWSQGPPIPPARNRGAAGVVAHGGALYVAGGSTLGHAGQHVAWLDRYEPASGAWTALPDAPHARDHFTAVVVGHRLYAAGGRRALPPILFDGTVAPVDVFDLTAGVWTTVPAPLPTPRGGTMAVAVGAHVVVIGGESAAKAHDEVEALDTTTGTWLTLPSLLEARHGGGAARVGAALHVVAGAGAPGGATELDTHEALVLTGLLPESPAQLLANGDFDDGAAGWVTEGAVAPVALIGGVAAPALALLGGSASQDVAAAELDTYTLHGSAFALAPGAIVRLAALDAAGATLAETTGPAPAVGAFAAFELELTTPIGTVALRVSATADSTPVAVDDLVLVAAPPEVVRYGAPANPLALPPTGAGPTLGAAWTPAIDHAEFAPDAVVDVLVLASAPLDLPTPFGALLVEPAGALVLGASPGAAFTVAVPLDLTLCGAHASAQGASVGADGALALTNALDLTLEAP